MNISNIHVANFSQDGSRASINWHEGEFRFHAWINTQTFEIERGGAGISNKPTIYKNPIKDEPGHRTKYLDATAKKNVAILEHVFTAVNRDGLVAKGRKQHADDEAAETAKRKQQEADYRREQFVSLLKSMLKHDRDGMIEALSDQLSMNDIDALQARLP